MLAEVEDVRQSEEESDRRWFSDDYFDLFVWEDEEGITGFQLCYDKMMDERALTWRRGGIVTHHGVDSGTGPHNMRTPILVADGPVDARDLSERFLAQAGNLDPELVDLVYSTIRNLET